MKVSSILGLNARTQLYSYRYNSSRGRKIAGSKLLTKQALKKAGVPTPALYAKFKEPIDILKFDWSGLPDSFALKPSKGLGGEGIIVVKKRAAKGVNEWISVKREKITVEDLKLHVFDILEGAYSIDNSPDVAYIEEYIGRHKSLQKYAYRGTPDLRIIVFNKVPVMAMLRLPTRESGGRANLHQGAIGVGIDISTGITTYAIWHNQLIKYKPGTKRKLHGIKIPFWNDVLLTALSAQDACGLGFLGADVVLHPTRGPMILEVNSQPGLSIQLANQAGLRKRLDRVDEMTVRTPDHGVNIAKALFGAAFSDRVKISSSIQTISALEEIMLNGKDKKRKKVIAKIDTGAWRTSINKDLAEELGLLDSDNILWTKNFKSSLGMEARPVINLKFRMAGQTIITPASVAKRHTLRYPVIIGRKDLKGFLVNPHVKPDDTKLNIPKKN